jgi:hypothetical protein
MNKTAERIIAISVFTLGLAACGGGKKEVAPTYHWVGGKPVDFTETEQSLVNRGYEAKARLSGEAIKDIDNSYALQDYGNLCAYFRLATTDFERNGALAVLSRTKGGAQDAVDFVMAEAVTFSAISSIKSACADDVQAFLAAQNEALAS